MLVLVADHPRVMLMHLSLALHQKFKKNLGQTTLPGSLQDSLLLKAPSLAPFLVVRIFPVGLHSMLPCSRLTNNLFGAQWLTALS